MDAPNKVREENSNRQYPVVRSSVSRTVDESNSSSRRRNVTDYQNRQAHVKEQMNERKLAQRKKFKTCGTSSEEKRGDTDTR